MVRRAGARDPAAIEEFCRQYRGAVTSYIRRRGFQEADAEDIAQEVFLQLFSRGALDQADAAKGKFRSLLLAVARHAIAHARRRAGADKRGGGRSIRSLDEPSVGDAPLGDLLAAPLPPDEAFDRVWVENLLRLGMEDLRAASVRRGDRYHQVLDLYLREGLEPAEIARRTGSEPARTRLDLHRARERLRRLLDLRVARYSSSIEEYRGEAALLRRYVS